MMSSSHDVCVCSPSVVDLKCELSDTKSSLSEVLRLLSASRSQHTVLESRICQLEIASSAKRIRRSNPASLWVCPVCREPFAHRESFKGHISRLAEPKSERSHCRLDPQNPEHVKLLSDPRFGDGDWDSRSLRFGQQFYDTVKSVSSSTRTSESSHSAVSDLRVMCWVFPTDCYCDWSLRL
jgi:hypothetical protein